MLTSARWNQLTLVSVLMAMFIAALSLPASASAGSQIQISGAVTPATVAPGGTVVASVELTNRSSQYPQVQVSVLLDGQETHRWNNVSIQRFRALELETNIPVNASVAVGSHSVSINVADGSGNMIDQEVIGTFRVETPTTPAPTPTATAARTTGPTPVPTTTGTPVPTATAQPTMSPTQPPVNATPAPSRGSVVRVNAGGPSFTDSRGLVWQADTGYSGGGTYSVGDAISGTSDDDLYRSERWGNVTYSIPAENGNYELRLLFAEIWFSNSGQRVFNVSVNGSPVLTNFDVLAETTRMTALDERVPVSVTNGLLQISVSNGARDYGKLSGFELLRSENAGAPAPTATEAPPPTTPSVPASIQALVDNAATGATVVIPAGTYRESISITRSLTLRGQPGAVIDGENRNTWIVGYADNVTIEGFEFRNTSNARQFGGLRNNGYSNWTIRGNTFRNAGAVSIDIRQGSNIDIIDNQILDSGQLGIRIEAVNSGRVAGNTISGSNQSGRFDPGWEAGGIKMSSSSQQSRNIVVEGNDISSNNGPGVWSDVSSTDITIRNNRIHHNGRAGIIYELSFRGRIHGNVIYNNGSGFDAWGFGAGIVLQNAKDTEVYDNVVAWNRDGISIISQNRGSQWNDVTGNVVRDNDIIMNHDGGYNTYAMAWLEDWNGPLTASSSNNRGQNNRFWLDTPDGSRLSWRWKSTGYWRLSDFARTPGGAGSTYMTTAQKDQILANAGL